MLVYIRAMGTFVSELVLCLFLLRNDVTKRAIGIHWTYLENLLKTETMSTLQNWSLLLYGRILQLNCLKNLSSIPRILNIEINGLVLLEYSMFNIIKFIRNNLCYIFCLHIVFKLHILKRHEVIFDIIYVTI